MNDARMVRVGIRLVGLVICSFALQILVPVVVYMAGNWWFKLLSTPNQPPTAWD